MAKGRGVRIVLWVLGVVAGLVAAIVVVGMFLPREHVVTRTLQTRQSAEVVWDVISDFGAQPGWWSEMREVTRLPDRNGNDVWREIMQDGMAITLETTEAEPPARLVRRIIDDDLPFSGEWEYQVVPTAGGSELTITERGSVSNPVFRFISRFFMDQAGTIESYLRALAGRFRETPLISQNPS